MPSILFQVFAKKVNYPAPPGKRYFSTTMTRYFPGISGTPLPSKFTRFRNFYLSKYRDFKSELFSAYFFQVLKVILAGPSSALFRAHAHNFPATFACRRRPSLLDLTLKHPREREREKTCKQKRSKPGIFLLKQLLKLLSACKQQPNFLVKVLKFVKLEKVVASFRYKRQDSQEYEF